MILSVLISLFFIISSCKTTSQNRQDFIIGERVYRPLKSTLPDVDTIPSYTKTPQYLMFDGNSENGRLFSLEYANRKVVFHEINVSDKSVRSSVPHPSGIYLGTINRYRVFNPKMSRKNIHKVILYNETEERTISTGDYSIYRSINYDKNDVVFTGYNHKTNQLGVFKQNTEALLGEQKLNPQLLYDLGAKKYGYIDSAIFEGSFAKNKNGLVYKFERWNRVIYLNGEKPIFVKTIDSCAVLAPKPMSSEDKTVCNFAPRPCDWNLVNSFVTDNHIVVFPRKVTTKDGFFPIDFYDKKTGEYTYSGKYGLPEKNKTLLCVTTVAEKIVAVYYDETLKDKLIIAYFSLKNI